MNKVFLVGGAGFIGSNFVDYFLNKRNDYEVIVYDNLSSGKLKFLPNAETNDKLSIFVEDVKNIEYLTSVMSSTKPDLVIHLAANPDISKSALDPTIDFWESTYLTQCVLESMRKSGVKNILFPSGSGVYGDNGLEEVKEDKSKYIPVSTYGASKIAGEALIAAYCYMFDFSGLCFRFANVIGSHQTHGVAHAFIHKLIKHPQYLDILGNGKGNKSYIHVEDVINAVMTAYENTTTVFDYYNVATEDYTAVNEIADIVIDKLGLADVEKQYSSNEPIGWKGDVGTLRFNTEKIRSLGWNNRFTSREAVEKSIGQMIEEKIWED